MLATLYTSYTHSQTRSHMHSQTIQISFIASRPAKCRSVMEAFIIHRRYTCRIRRQRKYSTQQIHSRCSMLNTYRGEKQYDRTQERQHDKPIMYTRTHLKAICTQQVYGDATGQVTSSIGWVRALLWGMSVEDAQAIFKQPAVACTKEEDEEEDQD